ncbi:hypothetical protein L5G28_08545 [Gordonia sp. HY285]|uniref:hypothetical protein n=1 Tax=Gordonia liuliyuniae TaxID=2911517 RepID=UPI001F4643E7|nr:hypothetical protein [Gordonia liuliyuniae]MCF8610206.1 hypothetical protein [Gordonia liuliyuniae]
MTTNENPGANDSGVPEITTSRVDATSGDGEPQGLDRNLLIAPDFILVRMALVDEIGWNAAIVLQRIAFRYDVHPNGWPATIDEICRETRLKNSVVKAAIKLLRTRRFLDSRRASTWDSTQVWSINYATPATPEIRTEALQNRRSSRQVGIRPPEESESDLCEESESDFPPLSKELEEASSLPPSTRVAGQLPEEDIEMGARPTDFAARASIEFTARGHTPLVSADARRTLNRQATRAVAAGLNPDLLIEAALKADSPSGWLVSVGMPGLLASRSVPAVTHGHGPQRPATTPSPAQYDRSGEAERRSAIRVENQELETLVASVPPVLREHLAEVAQNLETGVPPDVARRQAVRVAMADFPNLDPSSAIESWLRTKVS